MNNLCVRIITLYINTKKKIDNKKKNETQQSLEIF